MTTLSHTVCHGDTIFTGHGQQITGGLPLMQHMLPGTWLLLYFMSLTDFIDKLGLICRTVA